MEFEFDSSDIVSQIDLTREDSFQEVSMTSGVMEYNGYDNLSTVTEDVMEEGSLGINEVISLVIKSLVKQPELLKGNFGYHRFLKSIKEAIVRESGMDINISDFFNDNITFREFLRLLYSGAIVNNKFDSVVKNPYKVFLLLPGQDSDISYHKLSNGAAVYKSYPAINNFTVDAFENIVRKSMTAHKVNSLNESIVATVLKAGRVPPKDNKTVEVDTTPLVSNLELAQMIIAEDITIASLKTGGVPLNRIQAISKLVKAIKDGSVE
jgi:hypothetical protein